MLMKSESINELAKALAMAQSQMEGAKKDSKNPFYDSNYADLSSVFKAIRGPLSSNNLCVFQTTAVTERGNSLLTTLAHSSGQWVSGELLIQPVKPDPQSLKSAVTYERRIALLAIVGLEEADDDGEASMNRPGAEGKDSPKVTNQAEPYRIPFGIHKGKTLNSINPNDLHSYANHLVSESKKKNEQLRGDAKIFVEKANAYLGIGAKG